MGELLEALRPQITSKGTLACIIDRLDDAGVVTRGPGGRLKPGPDFAPRPNLVPDPNFAGFPIGRPVPAGVPDTGEAAPEERRSIDSWLAPHPELTRLVPIRGDSMVDAGLLDGDIAVYEVRASAEVGEIVYAVIDGSETIKHLGKGAAGKYLLPANPDPSYQPIWPKHQLDILGVVIGVFGRRRGRAAPRG
ncbi:LexA family protein [Rhodanobacter sp. FW106-PBR-R2A-1-13]|uniref:LexA family protein n=1 Tax=Rhodanobacter sp. FW106-PBR-R2A-1-13 TaxID=3454845 RepID=UPI0034E5EDDA